MSGQVLLVSARLVTMQRPVRIELVAERALAEKFLKLALERLGVVTPAQQAERGRPNWPARSLKTSPPNSR